MFLAHSVVPDYRLRESGSLFRGFFLLLFFSSVQRYLWGKKLMNMVGFPEKLQL